MNLAQTEPIRLLLWVLVLTLHTSVCWSADALQGEIRLQPAREGNTWVGQELELNLELWSDGFSFGDQLFVLPEVKGGYLLQADSNTVKLNENRNGTAWQGLSYTLLFYPQREGRLEVPSFEVRYTAGAGFGSEPTPFRFQTKPVFIDAQLPPGADPNSLLVTTRTFELESAWTPSLPADGPLELKVGDALTLEVTRKAADVPGMVFPPLPEFSIDGLGVYPGSPAVNDRINRGSLTGRRTDSVTFICEREGSYTLPELRFQWWDPDQEILSDKVIPAVELAVAVNPAFPAEGSAARERSGPVLNWKVAGVVIVALLLLSYPAILLARKLMTFTREWQQQRKAGESWAFQQVLKSCASGPPSAAYNAITVWLDRCSNSGTGLTLTGLATETGDEALLRESTILQEKVATGSTGKWNGRELAQLLVKCRKHAQKKVKTVNVLHPLNPQQVK